MDNIERQLNVSFSHARSKGLPLYGISGRLKHKKQNITYKTALFINLIT